MDNNYIPVILALCLNIVLIIVALIACGISYLLMVRDDRLHNYRHVNNEA